MLYPIGIQSFEKLRKNGYVYVDKTDLVYKLVKTGACYFLSRPRRFGKSLLMSTLEAYFLGKKELFKGLAIERLEKDWTVYPVIHIDLNNEDFSTAEGLKIILNRRLEALEAQFGIAPDQQSIASRFENVIVQAYNLTGQSVVVLVDEYDKPLLEATGNQSLQAYTNNDNAPSPALSTPGL